MAELPHSIAREAKSLHQNLKELLKTKEPFDREVEFQRKNLRWHYLNLLLVHPHAQESKDVENHLWMQTSYTFIASYKTRIATLDRAMLQNTRQQQQQQQQRQAAPLQQQAQNQQQPQAQTQQRSHQHGVVEYRKLVQRFRQFLAEEEKFWTLLVQRLYRSFRLIEAKPVLVELGLLPESEEVAAANANLEGSEPTHSNGRISNGRNQHQFPPENPDPVPHSPSNQGSKVAILSKALICLGDIARYRELYNDSNGRPRAGHDSVVAGRRSRNRRGNETLPRARNYDKAQKCYEQARLLVPNEGNPSHQLAILASYQKDTFLSLVHYYRALCVQQPYDTATDNLNTILSKTLDQWKARTRRERERNQTASPRPAPRVLVETFRERVTVLHALWRLGAERGLEKMDSLGRKHEQLVRDDFTLLVSERHLLTETISQIIVLSEGAFFKHRMIRPKADNQLPANTPILLDWHILQHILDLHSTLLNIGKAELEVPPPSDVSEDDLALKITATFRRTLPALRIASKWLRANFRTVMQDHEFIAFQVQEAEKGIEVSKEAPEKISGYSVKTIQFWNNFAEFVRALAEAFPLNKLPALVSPLDEDIDMRGFLPLKKLMGEAESGENTQESPQPREKPHPNVEQLMRISDLLEDAMLLVELPNAPIMIRDARIIFNPATVEDVVSPHPDISRTLSHELALEPQWSPHIIERVPLEPEQDEEVLTENTSPTDDDVVGDAFRALDNGALDREFEDDEEDQIVYLRSSSSPVVKPTHSPPARVPPITPVKSVTTPKTLSPRSPTHPQRNAILGPSASHAPHTTTAADLLNDVMGVSKNAEPSARFLQKSIWSASSDEQPLRFAAGGSPPKNVYHSPRQYPSIPLQDLPPAAWPSPLVSHLAQHNVAGTQPMTQSFAQSPRMSTIGVGSNHQHQRLSSLSSSNYQAYSAFGQLEPSEPFLYSSAAPTSHHQQFPISRPTDHHSTSSVLLSPHIMNSAAFNTVIGPPTSVAAAFGNPLATASRSSHFGGHTSPHAHTRQISLTNQSLHSPHHSHSYRSQAPGQPFSSATPGAW